MPRVFEPRPGETFEQWWDRMEQYRGQTSGEN